MNFNLIAGFVCFLASVFMAEGQVTCSSCSECGGAFDIIASPPNGSTVISNRAFRECSSLVNVAVAEGVTEIEEFAFASCGNLQTVSLSSTLVTIQYGAFFMNGNLTNLNFPSFSSLRTIGDSAFSLSTSLHIVYLPWGLTTIGNAAFGSSAVDELYLPGSITSIGYEAFAGCKGLKYLVLPYGLESVSSSLCWGCKNLIYVNLPSNLKTLEYNAFSECRALNKIEIPESVWSITTAFSMSNISSLVLPHNLTTISDYAFWKMENLTSITIPDSVVKINAGAFGGCSSLKCLNWNTSISRSIDPSAFDSGIVPPRCGDASVGPTLAPTLAPYGGEGAPSGGTVCFWDQEEAECGGELQEVVVTSNSSSTDAMSGVRSTTTVTKTYKKKY